MVSLLDKIFYRLRRDEIAKSKLMLRKIKIEVVFDQLTKCFWKHSIQYEVIIKNFEMLEIKLKGNGEVILFRFHKTGMVFMEDYERFILLMEINGIKKGIYITTGVFEGNIMKQHRSVFSTKKVKLEDGFRFIKGQLGLRDTAAQIFKHNKMKFYKYLPA